MRAFVKDVERLSEFVLDVRQAIKKAYSLSLQVRSKSVNSSCTHGSSPRENEWTPIQSVHGQE